MGGHGGSYKLVEPQPTRQSLKSDQTVHLTNTKVSSHVGHSCTEEIMIQQFTRKHYLTYCWKLPGRSNTQSVPPFGNRGVRESKKASGTAQDPRGEVRCCNAIKYKLRPLSYPPQCMMEDVFDNKYPVPRYPGSQTHAVLRRSTTQNLPPDPVFVHLKYNAADRPNMRWTQRNACCAVYQT